MAIGEASRREMHAKLEEVLGAQVANTVMEYLPPVGWADVATKHDLDAQNVLMKHDLDAQITLVRSDLDAQITLVRHDLDALSVLFQSKLDAGLARVSADFSDRLRTQTWVVCTTLLAGLGVFAAIARG